MSHTIHGDNEKKRYQIVKNKVAAAKANMTGVYLRVLPFGYMDDSEKEKWGSWVERRKDGPPRPWLRRALPLVVGRSSALELGPGAFNDTKFLLSEGFEHVTAVDVDLTQEAKEILDTLPAEKMKFVLSSFADLEVHKNEFDLVNAQFSLPFSSPDTFDSVFAKIKASIKDNGIFVGQFFGDRDTWKTTKPELTFHTEEEARDALKDMELLAFEPEEHDRGTLLGDPKHWHILHFIARKK